MNQPLSEMEIMMKTRRFRAEEQELSFGPLTFETVSGGWTVER